MDFRLLRIQLSKGDKPIAVTKEKEIVEEKVDIPSLSYEDLMKRLSDQNDVSREDILHWLQKHDWSEPVIIKKPIKKKEEIPIKEPIIKKKK